MFIYHLRKKETELNYACVLCLTVVVSMSLCCVFVKIIHCLINTFL